MRRRQFLGGGLAGLIGVFAHHKPGHQHGPTTTTTTTTTVAPTTTTVAPTTTTVASTDDTFDPVY